MRPITLLLALSLALTVVVPSASAQGLTDPNPATDEWIEATLVIEQPDLQTLDIVGTLVLRKYVVEGTPYETSDDIGDAYQQLLEADEFARANGQTSARADQFAIDMESNATKALKETLERNFPDAKITVDPATLDRSTLVAPAGNPYEPGVLLEIAARVERTTEQVGLGDYSADAIGVVFDLGARVSSDLTLTASPCHDVLYAVKAPAAPAGLAFTRAEPAGVASLDGGTLVVRINNAAGLETRSETVTATVAKPSARAYTDDEIAAGSGVNAIVDLQDIDIEIGKAIGGDLGNLIGEVSVAAELGIFALPEEIKGSLPASVQLDTLTANGIRLLHKHGAIKQEDIDNMETTFKDQVREQLQNALQVPITLSDDSGLAADALDAAGVTSTDGGAPLKLSAKASFVKPLAPGAAPAPQGQAAIALYTQTQEFDLPRVQGFATSYKVILPPGLAVQDIQVTGGESDKGTENGRDWFSVTPESDTAHATASMAVTPSFVIAKFWPVLLLAVLALFLLIGGPIAFVVMRKRGKAKDAPKKE